MIDLETYTNRGWRLVDMYSVAECTEGRCSAGANCRSPGKHPRERSWMDRAPRAKDIDLERSNVGIQTGRHSGLVVLDIDGDVGKASLRDLTEEHGALPEGPKVVTGSGGLHFYFAAPDGPVKTQSHLRRRVDVRGDGGLVVAAPSGHFSGKRYEIHGADLPLPDMPDWLLNLVRGGRLGFNVKTYLENAPVAVSGEGGHEVTIRVAAKLVRAGGIRSVQRFLAAIAPWNARCQPPWSEGELIHKFEDALERYLEVGLVDVPRDRYGNILKTQKIVHDIIKGDPVTSGRVRLNEMGEVIEYDGTRLDDTALLTIRSTIRDRYGFDSLGKELVLEGLIELASENRYSPVAEYLESLVWDGKPRLDRVAREVLGAEGPLAAAQVRKWMISAVARAIAPGCKVDNVLILQGEQGVGKSLFFDILGRPWYADTPMDITNKDTWQALQGVWLCEWGELATSWTKREVNAVKGFVSSRQDTFRPPFERLPKDFPRRCVFGGSTNDTDFLHDVTGSRRWWVVEVRGKVDKGSRGPSGQPLLELDTDWLESNRDQLWAEAVGAYRQGEHWTLPRELEAERAELNERFAPEDTVYDEAMRTIAGIESMDSFEGFFVFSKLAETLEIDTNKDQHAKRSIVRALKDSGYTKMRPKVQGARMWVYGKQMSDNAPS